VNDILLNDGRAIARDPDESANAPAGGGDVHQGTRPRQRELPHRAGDGCGGSGEYGATGIECGGGERTVRLEIHEVARTVVPRSSAAGDDLVNGMVGNIDGDDAVEGND
jgi:hypothetical protein